MPNYTSHLLPRAAPYLPHPPLLIPCPIAGNCVARYRPMYSPGYQIKSLIQYRSGRRIPGLSLIPLKERTIMKRIVRICFLLFFLGLFIPSAIPCTIFTVCDGETVLFGGNEDQTPNTSFVIVDKSGKYAAIYFATPWEQWPLVMQTGINEKGLCFDSNWIPPEKITPHPERRTPNEWTITLLMKECSTVREVLSRIHEFNLGSSISYQVHFADATGDAAVIHPGKDGEVTWTRINKEKRYLLSTNFNLGRLEKGDWSCWRYSTADDMLLKITAQGKASVASAASVLEATLQGPPYRALYSTIFDPKNLKIYLYYTGDFKNPFVVDVKAELARSGGYRRLAIKDFIAR